MTDQHRATPEQWANQEAWAVDDDDSACILELRARVEALEELHKAVVDLNKRFSLDPLVDRVEALEARYETQRQATLAWGKDVDNHGRWIDDHLKRIMALESTQHAHADTSQLSDEERRTASEELSKPGSWQPLRTEIIYGEANAHAQNLVRHLSMDQLNYPETPDSSRSPADSLVQRVSKRLIQGLGGTWDDTSRSAIREVAAWLRENDAKCQMGGDAAATADLLDAEANQ